ncbi:MAG TPA: PQQ-binding-like beta-propeller repeat protein [Kofleriaceae bacterium]|nr:PQQ-binding-like beta-propeller repeat protein [Kofleriaceae bacterium]
MAVTVDVQVYVDENGDGRREDGEPGVPYAVIGTETGEQLVDASGKGRIDTWAGSVVWARAFDGYAVPGPWMIVPSAGVTVSLGLRRAPLERGPWRFVVAADAHIQRGGEPTGGEAAIANVVEQATGGLVPPAFVIIAGDLTQNSERDEADKLALAFDVVRSPLVPAMGNHDSYDAGETWRARFGPDLYSFDHGGVHVIVLDSMRPVAELVRFAQADLATTDRDQRVIAVTHGPPEFELAEVLGAMGVELVVDGHWHVNRVVHRGFLEMDTEPWLMGGMDQTPAGYRVIEIDPQVTGRAEVRVRHYTTTERPIVSLVGPAPGQCAAADRPLRVIAALAGGPDLEPVRASIDGGAWSELAFAGGWDWTGELPAIGRGVHELTLRAGRSKRDFLVEACAQKMPAIDGDWPQLGGGPGRDGARAAPLGDHLAPRWVASVGGHLGAGSPVVAGGLVFVAPIDLADDQASAVVALELATGAERWRFRPGAAVRNALAVAGDTVIAAASDGVVYGLDRDRGDVKWRVDLGEHVLPEHRAIWGAPLVAGDRVFVGNQRRFAAIDPRTGKILWEVDPVPDTDGGGSFASPALVDGTVVTIANRMLSGVQGWDPATGAERFQAIDVCSLSAAAAPVADGDTAHLISGAGLRCSVDVPTGDTGSWGALDREGFEWAYEVAATPALARDTLVIVTQYGEAFAFDVASETLRWARAIGGPASIHAAHYRVESASLAATPVIAGDTAWIGTADGDVVGVELATGRTRATLHVGAPVLSGLAIAGDSLVVASYDGTVRVYSPTRGTTAALTLLLETLGVALLYGALAILARRRAR